MMHRLLLVFAVGALALAAQNPPTTVRLSGIAINAATDRPLASVQVQIGGAQRVTNGEGRFVFENAPVGRQTLVASKDNFMIAGLDKSERPRTGIDLTLRPGEAASEFTLYLRPAGSVTGQILSNTGEPLQNAVVVPLRYSFDNDGELRLHELVDGRIVASVADPTFARMIAQANLSLGSGRIRSSRTDDLGRYRIYNLDPGKYGFYARPPDSSPRVYYPGVANSADALTIDIASGVETRLNNVVMPPGINAERLIPIAPKETGVVVTGMSSVPKVQLLLTSRDATDNVTLALVSDAGGIFSTRNLSEGQYRVVSVKDVPAGMCVREIRQGNGRNVLREGLFVRAPETSFRITIDAGAAVIRGKAGPGATAALVPDDRGDTHLYRTATADQDSAFEMRCVEPGNYRLYAWPYLDGAAYRNAEFMKKYDDRGSRVRVNGGGTVTADVTVLEERLR